MASGIRDDAATRVLLVTHDQDQFFSIRRLLREASPRYALTWTPHYAEGLQQLLSGEADAALIDYRLSIRSGFDLAREAVANGCGVPLIILTALEDEAVDPQALGTGAPDYLRKSQLTTELLDRALRWAIRHQETLAQLRRAEASRRDLEERFYQTQKIAVVGRLASGVAHDFNNLLTVIGGFSEFVLQELGPNHPSTKDVREIRKAAHSGAALIRRLLAFSRRQTVQPQVIDLNEVVRYVDSFLRRLIGENIAVVTNLTRPLARVSADPGQIEQVIINLAVNARDAMSEGGQLTIATAHVELDQQYVAQHQGASLGPHVMLAVSDTGIGMDEAVQSHLFEPFFTTKELGKGTGLGLPTVHGIVKQSGGSISVVSERGQGSTFRVYLPVISVPHAAEPVAIAVGPTSLAGTETVLVVEDQREVRSVTREALRRSGYMVLEAGNGVEAIAISQQYGGPIHILLADVIMPEMGGRLLAQRLLIDRPEIRVIYTSGYTDGLIVQQDMLEPGPAFLQKPFSSEALLQKIREVIEADQPPPV